MQADSKHHTAGRLAVSTMQADSEHHTAGRLAVSTMQADSEHHAGWQWAPYSRQADSEHHAAGKQTAELMTKQRNYSDLQIMSDTLFYFSTLSLNIILLFHAFYTLT